MVCLRVATRLALATISTCLLACQGQRTFTEPLTLGGKRIAAETLNQGEFAYMRYCRSCHGQKGDGKGSHSRHLKPPAANLQVGRFKYKSTPGDQLPSDADLKQVIQKGIPNTGMRPWTIPEPELEALVQYIKTLSPRWRQ